MTADHHSGKSRKEVNISALRKALLTWYDTRALSLPWRAPPGERADPYAVWLSEVMLQQTTVAAVLPRFQRFIERWPNVQALAAAPLEDVLAEWAGLGYYARARNLHACARLVVEAHDGCFPQDPAQLRALPGIGAYTAAAIAAIAYNVPVMPVDGNVERITARLFAINQPLPAAKKRIAARAATLQNAHRPGDFAQAMMDLGRTVCTPKAPACAACPLQDVCRAHAHGLAADLPRRERRKEKPHRSGMAFILHNPSGQVLLRRRSLSGLLAGMPEFPSQGWDDAPPFWPDARPFGVKTRPLARVRHVFTHFMLDLEVRQGLHPVLVDDNLPEGCFWLDPLELSMIGLPSLMKKVARSAGLPA